MSELLFLLNYAAVGLYGAFLSASFCEIEWTKRKKLVFGAGIGALAALQGVLFAMLGAEPIYKVYPLITHIPLMLIIGLITKKYAWSLIAVLTAYLCCQPRRWAALLVVALLRGNSDMQVAMELLVTVPIYCFLRRYISPALKGISKEMKLLQERAAAYRHDLRHHLLYIANCLENEGGVEQAQEYIQNLNGEITKQSVVTYCENTAANLILSAFSGRAEESSIGINVQARLGNQLFISDNNLCVLLSNALENALNACTAGCRYHYRRRICRKEAPVNGYLSAGKQGWLQNMNMFCGRLCFCVLPLFSKLSGNL